MKLDEHLSRISTLWTAVLGAHGNNPDVARQAQMRLFERYSNAVYRYLLAILRDRESADDVFQQFALNLVRGSFRGADPARGRFREYIKTSLFHLIAAHHRQRRRQQIVELQQPEPAAESSAVDLDAALLESCRTDLLAKTWKALRAWEAESGQPYFTVLDYRTRHPEQTSNQLAGALTELLQPRSPLSTAGIRKTLERARRKYAELLVEQVSASLETSEADAIEQELIELGLHGYCRPFLDHRQ